MPAGFRESSFCLSIATAMIQRSLNCNIGWENACSFGNAVIPRDVIIAKINACKRRDPANRYKQSLLITFVALRD
eukprot:scaffold3069_cov215-Amphora_coffeaeformis.AAC.13